MYPSSFIVTIGYDYLDDEYCKTTQYIFSTLESARSFKTVIEDQGGLVFTIGEISTSKTENPKSDDRPIFNSHKDALQDLEDLKNMRDDYKDSHQVFEMDISEMDDILNAKRLQKLDKDIKHLESQNGLLKIICISQTILIIALIVS